MIVPTAPVDVPHQPAIDDIELSIVMPCLNEAETLALCIRKARTFLDSSGIAGEIIVADNGSTDGSRQIANAMGARLVGVEARGYGAALIGGIAAARGRYVIMGDADDSYDFSALMPFVDALRAGGELVMGDRFRGGIAKGAMPLLHRYLGNPVLSFLGRHLFDSSVGDFHCGLRGFRRDKVLALNLASPGMEFASEMVVKAVLNRLDVRQVPTTLSLDGRSRAPHLRTWRDGWRHLRFLLTHAPRHLFLYPGTALGAVGGIGVAVLSTTSVELGRVELSGTTLLFCALAAFLGSQLIGFGAVARLYGVAGKLWPTSTGVERFRRHFTVERGCLLGGGLFVIGLAGLGGAVAMWMGNSFGPMEPVTMLRLTIPAMLATLIGLQTVFTSFLIGLIDPR
ncbi:dolichol-P-glucose synthetase [Sphingomonas sp. Leaf24]|uniref:glycosyltransferase family 2 protein n=1 Tax=unclassified Sphingomonas TaxID=196159 RepID=UPI0006FC6253|nr:MULTISPECIES: glycosyltransferase family 2 protein [unclassified Sphingomonas]KQM23254.1 dolichol-P-glucose synthetase [Sphingomonas sp. Leaf5]KQM96113.1 dolichol-P-glucose synthetase [Sphingomonas sp. Leaf24]